MHKPPRFPQYYLLTSNSSALALNNCSYKYQSLYLTSNITLEYPYHSPS